MCAPCRIPGELGRASKLAARVYRELSKEQRKMVFVLYKKMTGVAKLALKYGKSEAEAEREVREYLMREGVVKEEIVLKVEAENEVEEKVKGKTNVRKRIVGVGEAPRVFAVPPKRFGMSSTRPGRDVLTRQRVLLFDG